MDGSTGEPPAADGVARDTRREVLSESRLRVREESWNELASANLVRSKPIRNNKRQFTWARHQLAGFDCVAPEAAVEAGAKALR